MIVKTGLIFTLVVAVMVILTCTTVGHGSTYGNVEWVDGSYHGDGDAGGWGLADATVDIVGGMISHVSLRRLNSGGIEVDYVADGYDGSQFVSVGDPPDLLLFKGTFAQTMITANTWNVDTISGATDTCIKWKLAVRRALEKSEK